MSTLISPTPFLEALAVLMLANLGLLLSGLVTRSHWAFGVIVGVTVALSVMWGVAVYREFKTWPLLMTLALGMAGLLCSRWLTMEFCALYFSDYGREERLYNLAREASLFHVGEAIIFVLTVAVMRSRAEPRLKVNRKGLMEDR